MRLQNNPYLPAEPDRLARQMTQLWREAAEQVNQLSEGRIFAVTNAFTAPPTTGDHQQGDKVWNSAPTELGGAGTKYVIIGWVCTAAGAPGTWLEMRTLTGN